MKIFITGGIKSGKTFYALKRAKALNPPRGYIATALVKDEDMDNKVKKHRMERGAEFETVEVPIGLAAAVRLADNKYNITVVDCLNMWLLNMMEEKIDLEKSFNEFIGALRDTAAQLLIVSNEVSSGVIPGDRFSREFVEKLGEINRAVAGIAEEVILMVAGNPVYVKGESNGRKAF
ncbi:MAG TPA: bifunctional adenosylcobinamide kinase/adenosylcobinamide-phosphate guanylyltransferase [bacterium]